MVCFSNFGSAYTMRIGDLPPARSGYGDPAQKLFKFKDGERIIAALVGAALRGGPPAPRSSASAGQPAAATLPLFDGSAADGADSVGQGIAVSSAGMGVRFDLGPFQEPSTRLGRKFMKLRDQEEVVCVETLDPSAATPILAVASQRGRVLLCKAEEVGVLSGPGRGVTVIKLDPADRVLAMRLLARKQDQLVVLKQDGGPITITTRKYQPVSRGGKGHALFKRGSLKGAEALPVELPVLESENYKNGN